MSPSTRTRPRLPHPARLARLAAAATAAVVLPLAFSACGETIEKAGEKAIEKAIEEGASGDVDVDFDGDQVKVENSDGTFQSGTELPEDFPDDIPLVGEVKAANTIATGGEINWTISTESQGSDAEVFADARSALEGAGFQSSDIDSPQLASFEKGTYRLLVNVAPSTDGIAILTYVIDTPEPPK